MRSRCPIKLLGHYILSVILAAGLCLAAYGCLGAYAHNAQRRDQLDAQRRQLQFMEQQQRELVHKQALLAQAQQFTSSVRDLKLTREDWAFYDVNVQAPLSYAAAREIIDQCADSAAAYYWPISLEVKALERKPAAAASRQIPDGGPAEVQLTVKGRFVARQQ